MSPAQRVALALSAAALAVPFIAKWEGRPLRGYRDPVGIPTSCYGHTGPDVVLGRIYSDPECMALLGQDSAREALQLDGCLTAPPPLPLYAAGVDLVHNLGIGKICPSTFVKKLNAGDWAGACAELPKWKNAGGKPMAGLSNRRADAVATFCKGTRT